MSNIVPKKTAGLLRILADQIDSEEYPDFVLIVDNDKIINHTYKTEKPFEMLGVLDMIKRDILNKDIN